MAPTDDSLANSISATDFLNLMSAFEPDETDEERQYTLEDLFGDNDLEDDGVTDDISSIGEQSSSYINTFFNNLKIAEADQGILALESEKEELSENARDRQNLLDNSPFDNFYDKFATKTAESDA